MGKKEEKLIDVEPREALRSGFAALLVLACVFRRGGPLTNEEIDECFRMSETVLANVKFK